MSEEKLNQLRIEKLAETFKTLSDPTRLKIIQYLSEKKEANVSDIAKNINMEQSATSHQLRKLKDLSLVKTRREGRSIYYSLDCYHVMNLYTQGLEHVEHTYIETIENK